MKDELRQGVVITDARSDELKWHDVAVHGFCFLPDEQEARFDLDYITRWPDGDRANFVVVPATLTFHGVGDCEIELRTISGEIWLTDIAKQELAEHSRWHVNAREGRISLNAHGFRLAPRSWPQELRRGEQRLSSQKRGGVCFD